MEDGEQAAVVCLYSVCCELCGSRVVGGGKDSGQENYWQQFVTL
jgi:hypothetical protein